MPWFKADDGLHSHPKARIAGLEAMGLWVLAGTLSIDYNLGGKVPAYFLTSFGKPALKLAEKLVCADLWEVNSDPKEADKFPFIFHDWDHFQPSVEEINRDREFARKRQAKRREALRLAREKEVVEDAVPF